MLFQIQNICHRSRCPGKNFLCQVGLTDKGYRYVCRKGYEGELCNEGNIIKKYAKYVKFDRLKRVCSWSIAPQGTLQRLNCLTFRHLLN